MMNVYTSYKKFILEHWLYVIRNRIQYALPLSYVYDENCIYFHSAKEGHKIDILQKNPKVSFCIIDQDVIQPLEYTTYFKSVIVFGNN